jgi:hypothetical protein
MGGDRPVLPCRCGQPGDSSSFVLRWLGRDDFPRGARRMGDRGRRTAVRATAIGNGIVRLSCQPQAQHHQEAGGWTDPLILACFALAAVLGVAFAWREGRTKRPMIDFSLFRNRRMSAGVSGVATAFFGLFSVIFRLTQYLQYVLGKTPLEAGVLMLADVVAKRPPASGGPAGDSIGAAIAIAAKLGGWPARPSSPSPAPATPTHSPLERLLPPASLPSGLCPSPGSCRRARFPSRRARLPTGPRRPRRLTGLRRATSRPSPVVQRSCLLDDTGLMLVT